jgi:DNA-binding CsgD family transcriptional regulator
MQPLTLEAPAKPAPSLAATLAVATLTAVLDEIDHGVIVVDLPSGLVRHVNRQARDECRHHGTLDLADGHAVVPDALGQRGLLSAFSQALLGRRTLLSLRPHCSRVVREAAAGASSDGASGHPDLGSAGQVSMAVVPLPRVGEAAGETAQAMLVFGKRQGSDALSVGFFARLHGLTPTEDAVLLSLCRGTKPSDIAKEHGVAISTVRTHVNSIRLKTGTSSIRDLVHKVSTLPPMATALRSGTH